MRLRTHAASSVDKEDGDIAVGCRHRHVSRVLLMTRSVCDEHATTIREIHVAIGDINRDPLLALGLEPVSEKREVDLSHRNRRPAAASLPRVFELVERNAVGLGEEASDERGLAVID
ncbi:unannotated protein [freshwater metagenome]|uniref:Unannotated protein n=1 Tax=freshwater metagenome TaxID=449393 RepID=A0A6J7IL92_9ZZZZ